MLVRDREALVVSHARKLFIAVSERTFYSLDVREEGSRAQDTRKRGATDRHPAAPYLSVKREDRTCTSQVTLDFTRDELVPPKLFRHYELMSYERDDG